MYKRDWQIQDIAKAVEQQKVSYVADKNMSWSNYFVKQFISSSKG